MGDIILLQTNLPHSSVVLLGNPSEARTEGKEGKRQEKGRQGRSFFFGGGALTRHLSIHLVRHVWGWGATTDHTLRGHVVTVRGLGGGPTLVHPSRTHGHVLSGRLQAHSISTKTHIRWTETHLIQSHLKKNKNSTTNPKAIKSKNFCQKHYNQIKV